MHKGLFKGQEGNLPCPKDSKTETQHALLAAANLEEVSTISTISTSTLFSTATVTNVVPTSVVTTTMATVTNTIVSTSTGTSYKTTSTTVATSVPTVTTTATSTTAVATVTASSTTNVVVAPTGVIKVADGVGTVGYLVSASLLNLPRHEIKESQLRTSSLRICTSFLMILIRHPRVLDSTRRAH
jgi:hypothetical protein